MRKASKQRRRDLEEPKILAYRQNFQNSGKHEYRNDSSGKKTGNIWKRKCNNWGKLATKTNLKLTVTSC